MKLQQIAGMVYTLVGTLGIFLIAMAMLTILRKKTLHNPFGRLCFLHFSSCLLDVSIQAVWNGPTIVVGSDTLATGWLGKRFGEAYAISWDIKILSQVALSLNRFVSITFSDRLEPVWTENWTRVAGFITCFVSFVSAIPTVFGANNYLVFTPSKWTYLFPINEQTVVSSIIGTALTMGSLLTNMVVDVLSFINLRRVFKREKNVTDGEWQRIKETLRTRKRIEARLLAQTFLQGGLLIATLFAGQLVSRMGSSMWYGVLAMFTGLSSNCIDGLIMLAFHYRTSRGPSPSTVFVAASVHHTNSKRSV